MARLPYTNFHDLNLDWIIKQVKTAYTKDNPPPYPVKSVNGKTGVVTLYGTDILYSDMVGMTLREALDYLADWCVTLGDDIAGKISWPDLGGNPGDVLALDNDYNPVWIPPTQPVTDYDDLTGKPQINGHTLSGNKSGADLEILDAPAVSGNAGEILQSNGNNTQSWVNLNNKYAPIIEDTASGPVASFPDGANNLPVLSLIADIVPVQAGSGDPSPSNPRPISGRGGITVYQMGNNLWDEDYEIGRLDTTTGQDYYSDNQIRSKNYIPVKGGQSLYFLCPNNLWVMFYDLNQTLITNDLPSGAESSANARRCNGLAVTMPNNCAFIRFHVVSTYGTTYHNDISINYPSSDTSYHAYNGKSPILEAWGDVAGTVYGGTLDVVSGLLTVKTEYINLGSLDWQYITIGTYPYFSSTTNLNMNIALDDGLYGIRMCEVYKAIPNMNASSFREYDYNGCVCIHSGFALQRRIIIQDSNYNDPDVFKNSLNNKYAVANLVDGFTTYQLTPQEVKTILGTNNIYSDSGDCSVAYRADTKLFILKVV